MDDNQILLSTIIDWIDHSKYNYQKSKSFNPKENIIGPQSIELSNISNVTFSNKKNFQQNVGIIFVKEYNKNNQSMIQVVTSNPKLDFIKCITKFFPPTPCKIVKGKNVKIGKNCSIGSDGFGYAQDIDKTWIPFPHYGNIIIEDDVTIGDNATIARGTLGDTIIRQGVKVDCGVHIAHNSEIGENTLLTAHVMIGGSAKIGKNCWFGPSTQVLNKINIGDNVFAGIGTNIINDVPSDVTIVGNPARILRKNK